MKLSWCLLIASIVVLGSNTASATNTSEVMCTQFGITGATYTVVPTTNFNEDFSPLHHAPRNIPIELDLPNETVAYIHFPIVEDGVYLIYTTDPDRLIGLREKNGSVIESSNIEAAPACTSVLPGGLSADIELGNVTGPRPIAIEFSEGDASTVRLIVSRDPINVNR